MKISREKINFVQKVFDAYCKYYRLMIRNYGISFLFYESPKKNEKTDAVHKECYNYELSQLAYYELTLQFCLAILNNKEKEICYELMPSLRHKFDTVESKKIPSEEEATRLYKLYDGER